MLTQVAFRVMRCSRKSGYERLFGHVTSQVTQALYFAIEVTFHMGNAGHIRGEVQVWKFVRNRESKSMSLTICVVVVVLNTHEEFRKMKSTSPSTLREIERSEAGCHLSSNRPHSSRLFSQKSNPVGVYLPTGFDFREKSRLECGRLELRWQPASDLFIFLSVEGEVGLSRLC